MALEAGATMHEVFAGVRCWQLEHEQGLKDHAQVTAERIFGEERWYQANRDALRASTPASADKRGHILALCFSLLHTSSFVDDENDDVRTIGNMELATIEYVDHKMALMRDWPIFVSHRKEPYGLVGIEQVFDVVLVYADGRRIRYIGTIDGATVFRQAVHLDENKTASRLDDGWRESTKMWNQITGYCAASTTVFGFPIWDAHVTGVKIKPSPRSENVVNPIVHRTPEKVIHWGRWVRFTVEHMFEPYLLDHEILEDNRHSLTYDYERAPRFTHSCNRYFRPCTLIPFCDDDEEGRAAQYQEMIPSNPSPSERAVMESF